MAVTSIWPIKGRLDQVIRYARNPEKTVEESLPEQAKLHAIDGAIEYAADELKTERREYVTCLGCAEENAAAQFMETKHLWGKTDGRVCYHGYQSFKAGEVDAQQAHNIGIALAQELWGDRFEVVVATHCNTGHYHNHFVINSVSFADGYKFYNSHEDYRRMREVSDRLCREAKLSVIEKPRNQAKHYAQWEAEKNGKPTYAGMVKADIDRAILASTTEKAFWKTLREMGYELYLYKKNGEPREQPSIRAPNAKKNIRLSSLGEDYALERITERILQNVRKQYPFPDANEETRQKLRYQPHPKAKGIYALYLRYCYELHILVKHPTSVKRVSSYLREDILKLERFSAQAQFLGTAGITTLKELNTRKDETTVKMSELTEQRKQLRNRLKQDLRQGNEPTAEQTKADILQVSGELKKLRKEVAMCEEIAQRSGQIAENITALEQQKESERKEQCDRTGSHDNRTMRRSR